MIVGIENDSPHNTPVEIIAPFTPTDFSAFLNLLDTLLDAVATRRLDDVSYMDRRQVIGWLKDIRYTSEELLNVLEQ